jgi:hypothetical protein
MPLRIHHDKMFVSGEAWRLFKTAHPEQDFSDFWLETSLKFSIRCFDLSSFFLLCKKGVLQGQVQVPRRFRRRSPLAQLPASSTLLMLAILPKTIVANPDMSSNFRFRFCAY